MGPMRLKVGGGPGQGKGQTIDRTEAIRSPGNPGLLFNFRSFGISDAYSFSSSIR